MRISDWSSDVCSSDLGRTRNIRRRQPDARVRNAHLRADRTRADPARTARRARTGLAQRLSCQGAGKDRPRTGRRRSRVAGKEVRADRIGSFVMPDLFRHPTRSEEHTSELQSLMRISYAVFCLKKKKIT